MHFKCANCSGLGHAAGDRNCPKLEELRRRFTANNEINQYRFFPVSEDSSTWEMVQTEWKNAQVHHEGEVTAGREAGGRLERATEGHEWEDSDNERGEAGGEGRSEHSNAKKNAGGAQTTLTGWSMSQPRSQSNTQDPQNE